MIETDVNAEIDNDLVNLSRLAASDSVEDVRLFLAKLVRKYRTNRPDLAARIDQSLKTTQARSSGPSIMRRNTAFEPVNNLPTDADSNLSLIRVMDDRSHCPAPILPINLLAQINDIVRERKEGERLAAHGIRPTRSAILVGPPGVGKTLSARHIAAQVGKPLWVLDLTTVMSSLLGKTGNNLRMVFDHAKANGAVLLLDEIDAIAKRRSDESDVGELKRLVTAILQEVDHWPETGLLLAATNHAELIDPALWRRFDAVLNFGQADATGILAAVERFMDRDLALFTPWLDMLASALHGLSLSEVERAVVSLRRSMVLNDTAPAKLVIDLVMQRKGGQDKNARLELAITLAKAGGMSHKQISELTGIARDTLRKYAGPSPIKGRGLKKEG